MSMPSASSAPHIQVFEPRPLASLGLWERDGWTLRAYGIAVEGSAGAPALPDALVGQARTHALSRLEAAEEEGHHYGLGFAVLNRALEATWLVTAWWAYDNILCTALSYRTEGADCFVPWTGPVTACVHEMAVMEFERGVWTRRMMVQHPDQARWMADWMPDGVC